MSEFEGFDFAGSPVKVKRVDPEVLQSGDGLKEALADAETKEIPQSVFDRRAAKAKQAEIDRRRNDRVAKSR